MVPRRRAARSAQPPADQPTARPPPLSGQCGLDRAARLRRLHRGTPETAYDQGASRAGHTAGTRPPPLSRKALIPGHQAVNPALLPPAATPISGRSVRASPPSDRAPLEQIFGVPREHPAAAFTGCSPSVTAAVRVGCPHLAAGPGRRRAGARRPSAARSGGPGRAAARAARPGYRPRARGLSRARPAPSRCGLGDPAAPPPPAAPSLE